MEESRHGRTDLPDALPYASDRPATPETCGVDARPADVCGGESARRYGNSHDAGASCQAHLPALLSSTGRNLQHLLSIGMNIRPAQLSRRQDFGREAMSKH